MSGLELLEEYYREPSDANKQAVILHFSYLVKAIGYQLRSGYQNFNDIEDILHEGIIALMDALDKFDATKNVKFESYASLRIRGAMIDYLRKQYWASRTVYKKSKDIDEAFMLLTARLDRSPTDQEMAEYLGLSLEKHLTDLQAVSGMNLVVLDPVIYESSQKRAGEFYNEQQASELPEAHVEKLELSSQLAAGISKLTEREQLVLSLLYHNDLRIRQIAEVLKISEPRVSQIHSNAVRKLRLMLQDYVEE